MSVMPSATIKKEVEAETESGMDTYMQTSWTALKEESMQHDQEHTDRQVETLPSLTPGHSSEKNDIDLKEFPSQPEYLSAVDHNRHVFSAESNTDIARLNQRFGKSPSLYSASQPRRTHRMFPKVRPRAFQCKYCSFSCPSATNLSIHMRVHTGEKPYKCGTCAYASARKQNLFRHISTVHKADHINVSGPVPATSAYSLAVQSAVEERMPVVENVYGNVQDVVLIDGDPVKIVGRDQGSFSASDAASTSPHIAQVFSCESASSGSHQNEVVEVVPVNNPASATEYSTRHYADGSRFIFAGGVAANAASTAISPGVPQTSVLDQQFNTPKEVLQQAQSGVQNEERLQPVQHVTSPDETLANKSEGPIQPTVYKEPITGALKRKQGRVTGQKTLKNILDSPLVLQNTPSANPSPIESKSSSNINQLEKMGTEIKIIQSEEDLEEVLEGRQQTIFRAGSSGISKPRDFTPSARSLSGSSSAESGGFAFARESPDVYYPPETSRKGGNPDMVASAADAIPASQTSMFRLKDVPVTKSSSMRMANNRKVTSYPAAGTPEDTSIVTQTSTRACVSSYSSGKNPLHRFAETQSHLSARNVPPSVTEKEGRATSTTCAFPNQAALDRKHHPVVMLDTDADQRLEREGLRKVPHKSCGRAALTVEVDLSKVMCCAARQWLKAHLLECEVCEINLPVEQGERHFTCGSRGSCGVASSGYHREGNWANESNSRGGRCHGANLGQRFPEKGRFSDDGHQQGDSSRTPEGGGDWRRGPPMTARQQEQASAMAVDDEIGHSDFTSTAGQVGGTNRRIISPRSSGLNSDAEIQPHNSGVTRQKRIHVEVLREAGASYHRPKRSCPVARQEPLTFAETSLVSSSSVPISSPYIGADAPKTIDRLARNINKSKQSPEYIAFLNADLNRGRTAGRRQFNRQKCYCDICGKVCHSKAQLLTHRRVHIETSQLFRCAICRYCTLHYRLLRRHIADKHSSVAKKNTFAECKVCKKVVEASKVTSHMQAVHGLSIQGADGKSGSGGDGSYPKVSEPATSGAVEHIIDQAKTQGEEHRHQDVVTTETDNGTARVSELIASPRAKDDTSQDDRDSMQTIARTNRQGPPQEN